MTWDATQNMVIVGFTSSGKSTTGRALGELLDMAFVDLDDEVEGLHVAERGHHRRCRDIFSLLGRDCFVGYERRALVGLSDRSGLVIALGGGTPVDEENRRLVQQLGKVVYLKAKPVAVLDRMKHKGYPKFLGKNPTLTVLEGFWNQRHDIYTEIADAVIDNSSLTPRDTALAIVDALGARDMLVADPGDERAS